MWRGLSAWSIKSAEHDDSYQSHGKPSAESLWGCVFAASLELSARPAASQQQQSAEDAVHAYTSMANCYEFYHKGADLIFITGLVEVVSRAQSSKAALSELFRFFLTHLPVKTKYLLSLATVSHLLIHLPKKTGHTQSKWLI